MKTVNIFSSEREIEDGALHRWFLETGSEEALRLLMQKYYNPICSHVFAILKDHQDADEITNETFLKAFNERETIKYPDKLVSWLYKTAKNAAIERLRARQRDVHQMPDLVSLDNLDAEREAAAASIFAAQQAQQIETQIETDQYLLTSLLRLLTEKDREVVEYLLDGLKPKQIAEVIDSTPEAVQKRWERILKWLSPIAHGLDELLNNLSSQERKIMERYLDNQPLKEISEKLGISLTNVEVCVKRVIKQWKKSTRQTPRNGG